MNIVTLTMNPALDMSTKAQRVTTNRKLRCETPRYDPGGGGINVSMAMKVLGHDSTAVFPVGGPHGDSVRDAVRFGVATGSAAVMTSGTQLCRREDVDRLLDSV